MSKDQDMVDTRALEEATKSNVLAQQALNKVDIFSTEFRGMLHDHESHDVTRFESIRTDIKSGFSGVYNRLWWGAGGIMAAMLGLIAILLNKVL